MRPTLTVAPLPHSTCCRAPRAPPLLCLPRVFLASNQGPCPPSSHDPCPASLPDSTAPGPLRSQAPTPAFPPPRQACCADIDDFSCLPSLDDHRAEHAGFHVIEQVAVIGPVSPGIGAYPIRDALRRIQADRKSTRLNSSH